MLTLHKGHFARQLRTNAKSLRLLYNSLMINQTGHCEIYETFLLWQRKPFTLKMLNRNITWYQWFYHFIIESRFVSNYDHCSNRKELDLVKAKMNIKSKSMHHNYSETNQQLKSILKIDMSLKLHFLLIREGMGADIKLLPLRFYFWLVDSMWPDSYLILSIFGHLQQWNIAQ